MKARNGPRRSLRATSIEKARRKWKVADNDNGQRFTQGYVGGFVPFCSLVLGTTKNSLFYQDSLGLSMKIMPIALQGVPHLSYLMNLLNLIE